MWHAHGPATLHQLCSKHPSNNCTHLLRCGTEAGTPWPPQRTGRSLQASRWESRSAWLVIDML